MSYRRLQEATKERLIECILHINDLAYEEVYDAERANAILLAIHETTNNLRPIDIEEERAGL
tara:strand:+ start:626 stop:811 length:186 start_codon:yes stop_codon:yes gene_type:complete